ncbi:amidohydrolase [Alkalicoccobacillus porphyridii]|uniref:5-methylthioadenosine/S-adenosylhomocysteine deaminase n=1 Tax=Alkalicoccobacillus porphyridii TaxID=2597270 RepID=A0A553ZZX5_9BACI|nr:amidohydrolase [Alkalicoccobacillus porphyridii]TSB46946.1 amidohydrolase [Alkalicoccobacillus porphyridii]
MITLIKNARIITLDESFRIIWNGYIVVEDMTFTRVEEGEPDQQLIDVADRIRDARGEWLMPGLYNTHGHAAMTLMRGYEDNLPLDRWLKEKIWPFEGQLTREAVAAGRALAMSEMISSGTIGFLEMYHLYMDDFAEEIERVGMRAALTRSVIGLCSREEQDAKLEESASFATRWSGAAYNRIQTMLAPHAPYTCPIDYIERIVDKAEELGLPVHMHLAETKKEVDDYQKIHKMHPLDHLDERGLLTRVPWLFAHGVHLEKHHLKRMSETHARVSHNPMSNLKLGSGMAPLTAMLDQGISVSIGCDGVSANNTLDLWEELRIAVLLQKGLLQKADALSVEQALRMITSEGASALQTGHSGMIKAGEEADFIMIDATSPHLQPEQHIHSHLVYAAKGSDVTDVYVQGKALMENRELLTLDKERTRFEANKEFADILSRVN